MRTLGVGGKPLTPTLGGDSVGFLAKMFRDLSLLCLGGADGGRSLVNSSAAFDCSCN